MKILITDNGTDTRAFSVVNYNITGKFIKLSVDFILLIDGEKFYCKNRMAVLQQIETYTIIKNLKIKQNAKRKERRYPKL